MLAPEEGLPGEESVETGGKAISATDTQVSADLLPADTGSEEVRTCYRRLLDNAIGMRDCVIKNREISPSPVIAIFHHIIDDNLIDDLFEYAVSVPDDFGPPSRMISATLAHMKVGKTMGHDTNKLLKSGFAALLRSADVDELPDRILQEDVLSPDDIALIRKHPGPTLDILAHLVANTSDASPEITEENHVSGEGGQYRPRHVNNTGLEQEATDKMEEPDNAYKELAEIASEKKAGSAKLLPGLIVLLAVIVVGALWSSGILSFDRAQETPQKALKEHESALQKEKISKSIEVPEPAPGPLKEATPLPDKQTAQEGHKDPLHEEGPEKSVEKSKPATVSEKPAPLPPHQDLKIDADTPPAMAVNHPYSLHMGSFKTLALALRSFSEFKKTGLSPFWTRVDLGAKGVWYRVFLGQFETADKADAFQKGHGIKADRILKTAYAVQMGIYTSKEELERKISELKESGHCPYYTEQPQNRYRLLIGAFQTRKAAEDMAERLKESGLDCEMILR